MDNLFYADFDSVQEVPYTRDRAMSVTPMFYNTRREALIVVKNRMTEEINRKMRRLIEIERELLELAGWESGEVKIENCNFDGGPIDSGRPGTSLG